MLQSNVLVLNKSFLPVQVISLKRAFCMLFRGVAKVLDKELRLYDFSSWSELSATVNDERIGLVGRFIRVPRVIILTQYNKLPKRTIRFSRYNILLRDNFTCQYCGSQLPRSQLNLDHVVPRSRGGRTAWENIVASCHECNRKKGWNLPHEARMKLIRKPTKPNPMLLLPKSERNMRYKEWLPFLNIIDFSYWNVELEE